MRAIERKSPGREAGRDSDDGRGGSGSGNGGTFARTGSRGVERGGPSGSKITRARKEKRPRTSGRGRNPEGEARHRTPSAGIRLWAVCQRGSAHEPPPENAASARDVVGMLNRRRVRAYRLRP